MKVGRIQDPSFKHSYFGITHLRSSHHTPPLEPVEFIGVSGSEGRTWVG